ncbi:unnamed protein product [Nippostrongylus brasiliensis]|uniref:Uncharacterized protein n=1 Tax=Nippostrongylus brasiliensis TaxID=27835 RepID=A0A0N4Y4R4_NIPBR|nr:unnamed protein product [Nippostrongylus brasiliensis]
MWLELTEQFYPIMTSNRRFCVFIYRHLPTTPRVHNRWQPLLELVITTAETVVAKYRMKHDKLTENGLNSSQIGAMDPFSRKSSFKSMIYRSLRIQKKPKPPKPTVAREPSVFLVRRASTDNLEVLNPIREKPPAPLFPVRSARVAPCGLVQFRVGVDVKPYDKDCRLTSFERKYRSAVDMVFGGLISRCGLVVDFDTFAQKRFSFRDKLFVRLPNILEERNFHHGFGLRYEPHGYNHIPTLETIERRLYFQHDRKTK